MNDYSVKIGDTSLSPVWGLVLGGVGLDLTAPGWTVRAQARDRDGDLVLDWAVHGAILIGVASFEIGPPEDRETVTASTVRLYLPPARTAQLSPRSLTYDVEINHPSLGPLGDALRYSIVDSATVRIRRDWAPT